MTTIFIQGTKHETEKIIDVLKKSFHAVNKKASFNTENGLTVIAEVVEDVLDVDGFSPDEILKALTCCSNADRDCATCPYKKTSNCKDRLQLDGAILIGKVKAGEIILK